MISPRLWRIYAHIWLVVLLFPMASLVRDRPEPVRLVIAAAGLMIFVALYTRFMRPYPLNDVTRPRSEFDAPWILFAVLMALVLALSIGYGSAFLWLSVGVSAVAGRTLPVRSAHLAVTILPLLILAIGVGLGGGIRSTDWLHLIPLVLLVRGLGLDMIGLSVLSDTIWELRAARDELAQRAVVEERLRLARDLHDLLGHTLSLITLKSELARRLIEREPVRAAKEISEVERVARQTLRDVRAAVAGYRQPTLDSALEGARQMLEAAGVVCQIEQTGEALPPAADTLLGWVVREGVTNVIRHSHARRCTIRIARLGEMIDAEVLNDCQEPALDTSLPRDRSGLAGLAQRVTAYGGHLEAGPVWGETVPGFRLRVTLPVDDAKGDRQ